MSSYAKYVMEREGLTLLEDGPNFLEYKINGSFLEIHGIFVDPGLRRQGQGTKLADLAQRVGREAGCCTILAEVVVNYLNATDSIRACLAYGFKLISAQNNRIILSKDITE